MTVDLTPELESEIAMCCFQEAHEAFLVVNPENFGIAHTNHAAQRLIGLSKEQLIGQTLNWFLEPMATDDLTLLAEACRQTSVDYGEGEFRLRRADGQPRAVRLSVHRIHPDPRALAVVVLRDVTRQRVAEDRLQRTDAHHRRIVETAQEGIWELDAEGRTRFVNPPMARMLGQSVESMEGQGIEAFLIEPRWADLVSDLNRLPQPRRVLREIQLRSSRGGMVWAIASLTDLPELGDLKINGGVLVMVMDITDRKRAEHEGRRIDQKLQQMQRLESLGVLAGGIAHDFNNLLTVIKGYNDLARHHAELQAGAGMDQFLDLLKHVDQSTQRAADLCHQLLAYSGRGQFVVRPLDLSAVVRDNSDLLNLWVSKKARLVQDLASNLPTVDADMTQLQQVIVNLVTNASEAIGDRDGQITIRTGVRDVGPEGLLTHFPEIPLQRGCYVWLEVRDDGCGMDRATLDRIFDPFFSTKATSGRGLGLSALQGIVRSHTGGLDVETELGRGTCFRVYFPTNNHELDDGKLLSNPDGPVIGSHGTILVADDEPEIRSLSARMLELLEFQVLQAVDGQQALEIWAKNRHEIRLAMIDLTMPRMDGIETFQQLQKQDPDLPIIIMSGFTQHELRDIPNENKSVIFLRKPFSFEQLVAHLHRLISVG